MSKVMICTPCYGGVVHETYLKSLLASQDALKQSGHSMILKSFGNESLITRARNNLTAIFLGSDADMLMFIDSDIGWDPEALLEIINSNYPLCGIPYPTKGYDWSRVARLIEKPDTNESIKPEMIRARAMKYTLNRTKTQPDNLPDGWVQVNSLGTGFMLIHRSVLEKMKSHYWNELNYVNDVRGYLNTIKPEHCVGLFETMIEPKTRRYLSEDYAFCRRWRDLGGTINACTKFKLSHTGSHRF